MRNRLEKHINGLFANAPKTKKINELREEILRNSLEKLDALIAEGKSEEAAYNATISGIGDISALIDELSAEETKQYGYTKEELERSKRRSAILIATAVMMYIISVIPVIITESVAGIVAMLIIIAAATGIIVYNGITCKKPYANQRKEMKNEKRSVANEIINSAIWWIIVFVYLGVSFFTMAWNITWLLFIFAVAVTSVVDAIFDLRK